MADSAADHGRQVDAGADSTADHGSQTDAGGWFCSGLGSADERRRQILQRLPAPVRHPLSPWALRCGAAENPGRHRSPSLSVWTLPTPRLEMGTGHWASPELTGHYRVASAVGEVVLVIS